MLTENTLFPIAVLFVFLRMSPWIILNSLPIFAYIPLRIKSLFTLMLAFLVALVLASNDLIPFDEFNVGSTWWVMKVAVAEFVIGLSIASGFYLVSFFLSVAGKLWDYPHGFATLNAFNPGASDLVSIYSRVFLVIFVFVFFSLNIHHDFIEFYIHSFVEVPLISFGLWYDLNGYLTLFSQMAVLVFSISFPIVFMLLVFDFVSAYLVKSNPGFNIYFISLPVKIFIGMLVFHFSLPYVMSIIENISQIILGGWNV